MCPSTDHDRLIAVELFTEKSGHYMRHLPSPIGLLPEVGIAFAPFAILARLNASYYGILDLFS